MSATRSLYRMLARSIKTELDLCDFNSDKALVASMARAIACDLKIDNVLFSTQTFFEAAGLDPHGLLIGAVEATHDRTD